MPNTITSNITAPDGTSTFDNLTATNLTVSGTLTGTATTLADAANITTGTLNVNRLPATLPVNIGIGTQTLSFSISDSTLTLTVDGVGSTSFTLTSG